MGLLKFISVSCLFFLFTNCHNDKYKNSEESFQGIYLKNWNSSICPKKIVIEKYVKDSKFKNLIESNSDFEIKGCEKSAIEFNQRYFIPNISYLGEINYDIRIIIDDSLEYKLSDINNKKDTVYAGGHAWVIMNNIKSLVINGKKSDNTKSPLNIDIETKLGKIIKGK